MSFGMKIDVLDTLLQHCIFLFTNVSLTLLPGGGGGEGLLADTIRMAARTLEPFHLESPKFLNF